MIGVLADYVFEPAMKEGGLLASSVGQWIGVGAGRGMALMFILLAFFTVLLVWWGYSNRHIRDIESRLADAL